MKSERIFKYIRTHLKHVGVKLLYSVLLLLFTYKFEGTPKWVKRIILGDLIYFLSPIDAIPDITPFLGFTDDLSLISLTLVSIAFYINKEIRSRARSKLNELFGGVPGTEINEVEHQLEK